MTSKTGLHIHLLSQKMAGILVDVEVLVAKKAAILAEKRVNDMGCPYVAIKTFLIEHIVAAHTILHRNLGQILVQNIKVFLRTRVLSLSEL